MDSIRNVMLFALILLAGCCTGNFLRAIDEDFYGDLAHENTRIAATLSLDVYHGPLDSLTYEQYIRYLTANESPSAKGLAYTVHNADARHFVAHGDSLLIVLYYRGTGQIVGDNSATTRIDTVVSTTGKGRIQTVEEVARLMRFR